MKKRFAFVLPFLALIWAAASADDGPAPRQYYKYDRLAVLEIAQNQWQLFSARAHSDWKAIYAMFSPEVKKHLTLAEYIRNPHGVMSDAPRREDAQGSGDMRSLLQKPYIPPQFAYRIDRVELNEARTFAKVTCVLERPVGLPGVDMTMRQAISEFWSRHDGGWKLEWDMRYLVSISGSKQEVQKLIPPLPRKVDVRALALWYMENARRLPAGQARETVLEKAFTLDPYTAVLYAREQGMDTGGVAERMVAKALEGRQINAGHFTNLIGIGFWQYQVGDYQAAYRSFLAAQKMDPSHRDALQGAVVAAMKTGDHTAASVSFRKRLEESSIRQEFPPSPFEDMLEQGCASCADIATEEQDRLFMALVNARRYAAALPLARHIAFSNPTSRKAAQEFLAGEETPLRAFGERMNALFNTLTYDDIAGLASAAGAAVKHPGDAPRTGGGLWSRGKAVEASLLSSPRLLMNSYGPVSITHAVRARAELSCGRDLYRASSSGSGYLAYAPGSDGLKGYYPDDSPAAAGSGILLADLAKLKKGTLVCLARVAAWPRVPMPELAAYLAQNGVSLPDGLEKVSGHAAVFTVGGGYARGWTWGGRLVKKLSSPGRLSSGGATTYTVAIEGRGDDRRVQRKDNR